MASQNIQFNGRSITHYGCHDCGNVSETAHSLRPGGKFCDPDCMEYVLSLTNRKIDRSESNRGYIAIKCPACGQRISGNLIVLKP